MKPLTAGQRESLRGLLTASQTLSAGLAGNDPSAITACQRLSREIADIAAAADQPELRTAAALLSQSPAPLMPPLLALLIQRLTMLLRQEPDHELVILIIDDDPLMHALLTPLLAAPGRRILTATTAAAGQRALTEQPVALIVLDLVLPDQDGRNLLIALHENLSTENIPVIVISGSLAATATLECLALGADAFYAKPFDPALFAAEVTAKLQRSLRATASARVDALTRLPNRAAFLEAFTLMFAHSARTRTPLTVGMFDIDRFKSVNDTYGHATGDLVLRRVAELVSQTLRKSDYLARWGGEEFTLFFPDSDCAHAERALEKALAAVRAEPFRAGDGRPFTVTFSAGLTDALPHPQPVAAVASADQLMYRAKAAGRNRIVTPDSAADPAPRRVLIVDDDPLTGTLVARTLQADGLSVVHCPDGEQALAAAAAEPFALFIIDLHLPGLDGFAVLQRLRAQPATAAAPVIILTGAGHEQNIVRSFELGASDYMVKPFSPVELAARVRRLLR